MRQFAEDEIVIPDGPSKGLKFRCERQPYSGLFFDAVDSGRYSDAVATGPVQSGKTLTAGVIPAVYHLFEMSETVIYGLPDMGMASDKWNLDILPVIEQTRYRELLPTQGGGSKGGKSTLVLMKNGAALRFMSGGGSDKSRAGFTARVLVVTEVDGLSNRAAGSDEADKLTQLRGRLRAYGSNARVYMECTLTTEQGRTWQEYQAGTASRIACLCPHCRSYVMLEREHLHGWQTAQTVEEARRNGHFACYTCGAVWSEDDRRWANLHAVLVHSGQEVPEREGGPVRGDAPDNIQLGFRWSAVNNMFVPAGEIAALEWKKLRSVNEDNAERELCQYNWAIPYKPPVVDMAAVTHDGIMARTTADAHGRVPAGTDILTLGIDVNKYLLHWTLIAWRKDGTGHVVDYDRVEVPSSSMATESAIMLALRSFRDVIEAGWHTADGTQRPPELVLIDSGNWTKSVIYPFTLESGRRYAPSKGHGVGQQDVRSYSAPKSTGTAVVWIGDQCHRALLPPADGLPAVQLVEYNADHWKSWVHDRLATPVNQPGSLTLFHADAPMKHLSFAKHLTAEKQVEEFHPIKGRILKWEVVNKSNHWFDSTALSALAAHVMGARITQAQISESAPASKPEVKVLQSAWKR